MMKKAFAALALSAVLACTAAPFSVGAAESTAPEDGQNPIMNFIGNYGAGRATVIVGADGMEDSVFEITWGSSAWETSEWKMSGTFDDATCSVSYENAVRKDLVFNESGEVESETVVYENGKGKFRFEDGGVMFWDDEEEHIADGMEFTWFNPNDVSSGAESVAAAADVESMTEEAQALFETETEISEGNLVIRIRARADKEGFSWGFDRSGAGEDAKVELLTESDMEEGLAYAGSFRALSDGEATIRLLHDNGVYVDTYMDFDVLVEGNEIKEVTGSMQALPTDPDELGAKICGSYKESADGGKRALEIARGEGDAFAVKVLDDGKEIISADFFYDELQGRLVSDADAGTLAIEYGETENAITWDTPEGESVNFIVG